MKILSWNVNGLKSTVSRGFAENIIKLDDDIICLQETKVAKEIKDLKLDKYYKYYNHPKKTSYAGVAIFTKKKPENVYYGIEISKNGKMCDVDNESRVITLEYNEFFIVSVYVPRSRTRNERTNYRIEFNSNFRKYIEKLNRMKNVIICGDFNTCYQDIDILNKGENRNIDIFFDEEKDGFSELLELGFIDTFRYMYPKTKKYTFRASKLFDKQARFGWRLDYILISDFIKNNIVDAKILNEIPGSDHCPIELEIKMESDNQYGSEWKKYDFKKAQSKLYEKQCRLSKAVFYNNNRKRIKIQNEIVNSKEAKMLAIRKVSETVKLSAGVDKILWRKDTEKLRAAKLLNIGKYKATPLKRIIIEDENGQKRKLGIPTIYDRAMLELYSYALEPVAEVLADRKSFAFRKGRTHNKAHATIIKALTDTKPPEWILTIKIDSCYEYITNKWIIKNIPMQKSILRQFIKVGIIQNGELFEKENNFLVHNKFNTIVDNMLLDGLQKKLYEMQENKIDDYYNGYCLRFADRVLITARDKINAEKLKQKVKEFVDERGLKINEKETKITNIKDGFEFLSRFYYKENNSIKCVPSKKAIETFEKEIDTLIINNQYKWSQSRIIQNINEKINKFALYHRYEKSEETFRHLDVVINAMLLKMMKQIHPNLTKEQIIKKFWKPDKEKRLVYTLATNKEVHVNNMADISLINERPMNIKKNIFLDRSYFKNLQNKMKIQNCEGIYKSIWKKQKGKCYICSNQIKQEQEKAIIYNADKMVYVHKYCEDSIVENIYLKEDVNTLNVLRLLKNLI